MVSIRLNEVCNFACRYCFPWLDGSKQMSKCMLEDVIAFLKEHNVSVVDIPQREPLYNPALFVYAVERLNVDGIKVSGITTNLFNLNKSVLHVLKKYDIFVLVSYDGLWQDEFRVTVNGTPTSEVVERNIYALKGAGVRFNVACTVTHEGVARLYDNYHYLKNLGGGVVFNFDTVSDYRIREDDIPRIVKQMGKIVDEAGFTVFPLNKIYSRVRANYRYSNHMCGAGRGSYAINWDGLILPCYQSGWDKFGEDFVLGDIYTGIDTNRMKKFREYDTSRPDLCRNCDSALCGICYLESGFKYGNPFHPDELKCELMRQLTRLVREKMDTEGEEKKEKKVEIEARKDGWRMVLV